MAKWVDQGEERVGKILFGDVSPDATLYLGLYKILNIQRN